MNIKTKLHNLKLAYSNPLAWIVTIIGTGVLGSIFFTYTNVAQLKGNLGVFHAYSIVVLQALVALLFGMNGALLSCKLRTAYSVNKKELGGTTLGSIVGLLVIGCPLCNITIASYLGLATVVSALPFVGLELKVASVAILLYSTNSLLKTVNTCEIPVKKQ